MLLAHIKHLAVFLWLPLTAALLPGCSAIVADLVILPFRIVGEAVEFAMEDHGPDGTGETGSEGTDVTRITGYCLDPSRDVAYPLYSSSSYVGECGPGNHTISRAEYDELVLRQAGAYCADATSGRPYRASSATCASGDETLTKSDYEERARS